MIILLGYWVQQLPIPLLLQYSTLILLAFVAILATYLGAIHPLPWLRYCFGMKAAWGSNPDGVWFDASTAHFSQ